MNIRCPSGALLVTLLSIAGLAAGSSDVRLADAVQKQNKQATLAILNQHPDVNAPQADGATALHWAVHWEDVDTTDLLIRAGANVNASNDYGITPLSLACENGNAAIIEKLLRAHADANATVRSGETPLMLAARTGRVNAVTLLLNAGADVNARETWNGQTALMWAVAEGHADAARVLIEHKADLHARSNSGATPLFFAARHGDLETVRTLIAAGADVNERRPDEATPLLVAVVNGRADVVDLLLDHGADPNVEGGVTDVGRPGTRAKPRKVTFPYRQVTEEQAGNRTGGNLWGTPLVAAVHVGNPELSDVQVSVPIDRVRVIKALLAHGAQVNAQIRSEEPRWAGVRYHALLVGATPLLLAAKASDLEVMRLLVASGADPAIATTNHTTVLMAATGIAWSSGVDRAGESEALEAVRFLVQLGVDVNSVNDLGETPMHGAAYRGANSIVQFLVDHGAKIDAKDKMGRTPLMIADGVAIGTNLQVQPETATLLRRLGAADSHQGSGRQR
jgi:ankyrin repeat protein